jgi:hypothetical protein
MALKEDLLLMIPRPAILDMGFNYGDFSAIIKRYFKICKREAAGMRRI